MADQISGLLSPWLRAQRIAAARPYLSGRVLDFGCGTGELVHHIGRERYVGLDIDEPSLAEARRRFPEVPFLRELEPSMGELQALGPFDTIVGLAVIEHLPEPARVLERLRTLLSPTGQIVLTTPHPLFEVVHRAGATLGLFSREAKEEHEQLLDRQALEAMAAQAGLFLACYRRFLFGANQLALLRVRCA